MTGRHYDVLKMDDTTTEPNGLTATLRTATGIYYEKAMIENLKTGTPFMSWDWECACGSPVTKRVGESIDDTIGVCDGCAFRYQVMRAAGRLKEFYAAYDKQKLGIDGPAIGQRKPLPSRSGKTIQMYQYQPLATNTAPAKGYNYLGKPRKKK